MKINRKFAFLCLAVSLAACKKDNSSQSDGNVSYLYLDHFKTECSSFALEMCLRAKTTENGSWEFFYDRIEGLDYEWGNTYKIKVKIIDIANPPEDSSSKRYQLLTVLQQLPESDQTLFDVSVSRASGLIERVGERQYRIYGDKDMTCQQAVCDSIDSLIAQDQAMLIEVHHQEDVTQPLVVTQVKCSASRDDFISACL